MEPANIVGDATVVLTVNAGSSSTRLAVFGREEGALRPLAAIHYRGAVEAATALHGFLNEYGIGRVGAVAHRVVHGGESLVTPCLIDARVETEIDRFSPLAPLHNPVALAWIRACRALFGTDVPQVAVFDTAFYADLPPVARAYAIPRDLARKHGVRRYGFHGIAHQTLWRRWRVLRPHLPEGGRVISLQLGAGCSITAVNGGRAVDTSMGFSPLEGLLMATRCGDLDPGLLLYLQRHEGMTPERLEGLLNEESGLLGVSGESADMRVLLASDTPAARLAVDLYCYRARKYLGGNLAALGGADAVLFGGGVGENAPQIREAIVANMEWAGVALDAQVNSAAAGTEACISRSDSRVQVWVIPVDEAAILAEEAVALVPAGKAKGPR
ncbi:MAG: acetate/propionate family kinase [Nitrospirota bacterium]